MKQISLLVAAMMLAGCGDNEVERSVGAPALPREEMPSPEPSDSASENLALPSSSEAKIEKSELSENVVISDPIVRDAISEMLKKPSGKLAPPVKFTQAELYKVRYLDLSRKEITNASLKDVPKLGNLGELLVGNTKITDTGLVHISKLHGLHTLYLNGTETTTLGIKELAKLPRLKVLRWNGSEITDSGLDEIAKLKSLTELNLTGTQITDESLPHLARLQNLISLGLLGTKITDEGAGELRKALPKCTIYHSYDAD